MVCQYCMIIEGSKNLHKNPRSIFYTKFANLRIPQYQLDVLTQCTIHNFSNLNVLGFL